MLMLKGEFRLLKLFDWKLFVSLFCLVLVYAGIQTIENNGLHVC